ncbi:MAG: four helix bundle protein [Kiritimatiellae bacterium]|nr:four helix bundle protein [Kiritimatiellia bacterium]
MAKANRFEDLDAWKLARVLTTKIYGLTKAGEFSRDYGQRDQICRAAVSIVSNIAEGFERKFDKSLQQFLTIAKGSAGEVRAQPYVALDLGYISQGQFDDACQDVSRISKMLSGFISYLGKAAPFDL